MGLNLAMVAIVGMKAQFYGAMRESFIRLNLAMVGMKV